MGYARCGNGAFTAHARRELRRWAPNMVPPTQPWPPAAAGSGPMPVAGPPQGPPPNWQVPPPFPPTQPAMQPTMPGGMPVAGPGPTPVAHRPKVERKRPSAALQPPRAAAVPLPAAPLSKIRAHADPSFLGGTVYGRLLNKGVRWSIATWSSCPCTRRTAHMLR